MQRPGLAILLALGLVEPAHAASPGPSVLVVEARLEKGSLPHIVTAYGSVTGSPAARRTVAAPLAAIVAAVLVRVGEEVDKDAPLVRLRPSPAAAAAYAQTRSALAVARQLVARTKTMLAQHLATGQQLADAEKSEADAQAALAALDTEGAAGPQTLRAPFRAVVTAVTANAGALVAQGAGLVDLDRPEGLVLRVGVVPAEAVAIRAGDKAAITPLGRRGALAGTVLLRGSVVDPATGLVPVEIAVPPGRLLSGEMAQAHIVTGEAWGYVVPHSAILVDDRGAPYVVQAPKRIARLVPVRILGSDGAKDVVAGPLDPTAPLVLSGNHQLQNGMAVRLAGPGDKGE
jgi:membrane fusion protein, multidrug efflux system